MASLSLFELVSTLARAADDPDPLNAVTKALKTFANRTDEVLAALSFLSGLGSDTDQSFYRAPNVSLLKVQFDPGAPSPPHDHGTWAAILLLEGAEKNSLYQREGDTIRPHRDVILQPGEVLPMATGAIHVVDCAGDEPAVGLHVYGGDLPAIDRSVWHPETLEEHPLTDDTYAAFKAVSTS